MRLEKIQKVLKEKNFTYTYTEEDGCGSIDFEYRGVVYHVWEFQDQDQWVSCMGISGPGSVGSGDQCTDCWTP